ncbi:unnamed protein product [Durusdinium trenchii]|uniref:KATNIP domain-containing protein n=1 Tax=Durusdinium trenchii TaxID=1381693 RepID=A0ABP0PXC2_9DINO
MAEEVDFDSKEDYELYKRLMSERSRIQRKEERVKHTKAPKARPLQMQRLEDRERGFQLHFAGANEERLKQAKRRQQQSPLAQVQTSEEPQRKEWQMKTVELHGKDGEIYRSSPHAGSAQEVDEEIDQEDDRSEEESRPNSASNHGLDQDTRGVLHLMNAANQQQLSWLRQSLTSHFEHRVQSAGSGLPPQPRSRPASGSITSIADAIQAENARVRGQKLCDSSDPEAGATSDRYGGDFTSGGSRPSSRSSRSRLPLGPEEAAQSAPPSVLAKASSQPIVCVGSSMTSSGGYPGTRPTELVIAPQAPEMPEPSRQSDCVTFQSLDSSSFPSEIFDRVSRLDAKKQKALMKVLESLEAEDPTCPAAASGLSNPLSEAELRIRVVSNWGDMRQCGFSLIEALDSAAEVVKIPPAALSLHGAQQGSTTLARVVERASRSMWLATVCQRAHSAGPVCGFEPFDLKLNLPRSSRVAALRLWNFNSLDGLTKGVREIEVWQRNLMVWTGEVPKGTGSMMTPLLIPIQPSFPEELAMAKFQDQTASSSADHAKDIPMWLPSQSEALEGSSTLERSEWSASHSRLEDGQEELLQSLQALELFRSSQSRRFFPGRRRSESEDSKQALEPAPPAPSPAPMGFADTCEQLVAEAAAMGLDLPVRTFDGTDVLDSLMSSEPRVMGSSLVASQLSQLQSAVIPTLPCGRQLVFNCVSTWGDKDFVGLAGIELFDGRGFPVVLKDVGRQVKADPHSINVLGDYDRDPRTPDKLFDQVNLTRDDLHVWLAPFFGGRAHTITVDLECEMEISMIRVWNYNKSRLHSSRGVRDMEILLDGFPIFLGEIRRAPGVLTEPEEACEVILFTQDESVLEAVAEHDWLPACLPLDSEEEEPGEEADGKAGEGRPPTAGLQVSYVDSPRGQKTPRAGLDGRPMTRATERQRPRGKVCSSLTITVHSTWGDQFYVGLTALEVLDSSLNAIQRHQVRLDAFPRDLNDLEGVDDDLRILDNIFDGVCCTTDDSHMWLAPFLKVPNNSVGDASEANQRNTIRLDFANPCEVAGFNIWNYNKNMEDTCRGIREFSVHCDDRYVSTFLCRKAPGHTHFDFKQLVLLDQPPSDTVRRSARAAPLPSRSASRQRSKAEGRPPQGRPPSGSNRRAPEHIDSPLRQQYETPLHPCGFIFKFLFHTTWSDVHYIGLDGIEIYDQMGRGLRPKRAYSNHGSVRDLCGMEADVRSEDSLLKGAPQNSRMWLAPYYRLPANFVELVFDEPTQISAIKFWNYSRTPGRGVRDLEIYVDDLLVYQGILRQASGQDGGEAVLFTDNPLIRERERSLVYKPSPEELIAFFDESGQLDQHSGSCTDASPSERPMTALTATA